MEKGKKHWNEGAGEWYIMVVIHFQAAVSLIYRQTCLSAMVDMFFFIYRVVYYRQFSAFIPYLTNKLWGFTESYVMADMMGDIMKLDFSF